jgi:hypothetical protein
MKSGFSSPRVVDRLVVSPVECLFLRGLWDPITDRSLVTAEGCCFYSIVIPSSVVGCIRTNTGNYFGQTYQCLPKHWPHEVPCIRAVYGGIV